MNLQPGDLVADRYRIEQKLGAGGMSTVLAGRDMTSGQLVAIKVLHPMLQRDPVVSERFVREALAARALATPHAVKVDASGSMPDGTAFMVMEFLHGQDLAKVAEQAGRRLDVERTLSLMDQVAAALEEAHHLGIVHRDLKPDNIFVIPSNTGEIVKVVDFGISKILSGASAKKLTQTGVTVGTPQYMPIEQLRAAKDLDGRVDVYALGVILYELLSGVRPYDGFTYEEVILTIATTTAPPVSTYRPDLPPGLVRVVELAMAREREQRFGSMRELRRALAPYWSGRCPICMPIRYSSPPPVDSASWRAPPSGSYAPRTQPVSMPSPQIAKPPASSKRLPPLIKLFAVVAVAAGISVMLVAGSMLVWLLLSDEPPARGPAPAVSAPARSAVRQ